jgi:hypothetical protein
MFPLCLGVSVAADLCLHWKRGAGKLITRSAMMRPDRRLNGIARCRSLSQHRAV